MPDTAVTTTPDKSELQPVMLVYILYFIGFFTGLTALAGVIIAHLKTGETGPVAQSHYTYQKRTFWFGVLYLFLGGLTWIIAIGYLIWLFWFVWTLVRCIKGFLKAQEGKPIDNPTVFLW